MGIQPGTKLTRWSEDDDLRLAAMAGSVPVEQIMCDLGRTKKSIEQRAFKINVSLKFISRETDARGKRILRRAA